jgi:hypothetical protein
MAHITLPERFFPSDLIALNDQLWATPEGEPIELDFERVGFLTPMAMIFLVHRVRAIQFSRKNTRVIATNIENNEWLRNMGLLTACGLEIFQEHKNRPGDSENYIPITVVKKNEFIQKHGLAALQEGVDHEAAALTRILLRVGLGPAFDAVQYSLREIIRNVFEHSAARTLMYCAQYYPKLRRAHLVIGDDGIGIPNSLRNNPKFLKLSDKAAVEISLMPGVSGNYLALSGQQGTSRWTNSGYGLYMTSRLCRNAGQFYVFSNNYGLVLSSDRNNEKSKFSYSLNNFKGTLICMNIDLGMKGDFSNHLKKYAEEGKEEAKRIAGAKVIDASTASLMLRRDFERSPE